jgi:hypothetical protein
MASMEVIEFLCHFTQKIFIKLLIIHKEIRKLYFLVSVLFDKLKCVSVHPLN